MKITIQPSQPPVAGESANEVGCVVAVEHPYDDLNVAEAAALCRQALLAWGFSEANLKEYFDADL
jgi:hypothetical protein